MKRLLFAISGARPAGRRLAGDAGERAGRSQPWRAFAAVIALAAFLAACTVGPNYRRPQVATPAQFRAPEPLPEQQAA